MDAAVFDFESRSACDLQAHGSYRYSMDPTTEIMCLGFRLPIWKPGVTALWHPAYPHLDIAEEGREQLEHDLFSWIKDGGLVCAHNAMFERGIWHNVAMPRLGWPAIPDTSWRCTAAKAAAHALPRNLGKAGAAIGADIQKDDAGHKLMLKLSSPRTPSKKEVEAWEKQHGRKPMPILWHESREEFERLWDYCRTDVLSELCLSDELPDLSPDEVQIYLLDQTINERGFLIDRKAVNRALYFIRKESTTLTTELNVLTNGTPDKATKRAKMLEWFASKGLDLPNTQAATVKTALEDPELNPDARRGLEIMTTLGFSSTAKYETMLDWVGPDDRVRGTMTYHGASTGRWTGSGPQPHNLPKGKLKIEKDGKLTAPDMDDLWSDLLRKSRDQIREQYGDVYMALSHAVRGAIVPTPGNVLMCADYAGIEARIVMWLAEQWDAVEMFRSGADIYCDFATDIYHRPITKADPEARQLGKVGVLGCGFQMGASKFVYTAKTYGVVIDQDNFCDRCGRASAEHRNQNHPFECRNRKVTAVDVVNAYRTKYYKVKQLWYDMEEAAIAACESRQPVTLGRVTWEKEDRRFLYCTLPSGRRIAYADPRVRVMRTSWGAMKPTLTFMGIGKNHQWERQKTYGGSLVENVVQATARDIMAPALLRLEQSGVYKPVLSVHDEVLSEANPNAGTVEEYVSLLTALPAWADGAPIAAEGKVYTRYQKS